MIEPLPRHPEIHEVGLGILKPHLLDQMVVFSELLPSLENLTDPHSSLVTPPSPSPSQIQRHDEQKAKTVSRISEARHIPRGIYTTGGDWAGYSPTRSVNVVRTLQYCEQANAIPCVALRS